MPPYYPLIIQLQLLISRQSLALERQTWNYETNARTWNNVYKQYRNNPLPDRDYKQITARLAVQQQNIGKQIRFLTASIESAKAQMAEIGDARKNG